MGSSQHNLNFPLAFQMEFYQNGFKCLNLSPLPLQLPLQEAIRSSPVLFRTTTWFCCRMQLFLFSGRSVLAFFTLSVLFQEKSCCFSTCGKHKIIIMQCKQSTPSSSSRSESGHCSASRPGLNIQSQLLLECRLRNTL